MPDGRLCSLLRDKSQLSDLGITVSGLFKAEYIDEYAGSDVLGDENSILISAKEGTKGTENLKSIRIIIRGAEIWSGRLSSCRSTVERPDFAGIIEAFRIKAPADGFSPVITGEGRVDIYSRSAAKILDGLSDAGDRILDLSFLVGLGIGFTPSGDDFISGVLLYEVMYGNRYMRVWSPRINRDAVIEKLEGTTPGGKTLLSLVCNGSFPAYLKEFHEALCGPYSSVEYDNLIKRVLDHGATSGSDALSGFLWAAKVFDNFY